MIKNKRPRSLNIRVAKVFFQRPSPPRRWEAAAAAQADQAQICGQGRFYCAGLGHTGRPWHPKRIAKRSCGPWSGKRRARNPESARARKCSPPFRGGLRPPHGEKKEGEKTSGGPCQASVSRGSGILFFIIHHEICNS